MAAGMSGLALLTATVLGAAVFAVLAPLWLSRDANPPSNCHIRALTRLRDGSARRICLEFTEYSAWADYARHWAWAPLCWTGVALQRLGWFLIQDGELLRSGHWLHFTWITPGGEHWEFVPNEAKRKRHLPPLIFRGVERRVPPREDQEWT